jgi:subtilisin family serine protease
MRAVRPRHRGLRRTSVLGIAIVGVLAALPMAAPVLARDPATDSTLRPSRPAWDDPATVATPSSTASRYIVRYRSGVDALGRRLATTHPGVTHLERLRGTNLDVVLLSGDGVGTLAALRANPRVASVEVDGQNHLFDDPTGETYWSELWGMHNTGQKIYQGAGPSGTSDVDIDEPQALGITTGSSDLVVAVIDDGVDFSHPDLSARAWVNPGESGGGKETNGLDDDHNGYTDDVNGWDFCHEDNTVHDFNEDFHGTHVAGTIAASLDGAGVVGVAPNVKIMALKFIGAPGCGLDTQAIKAIEYAKSFGVHLANASWGEYAKPSSHGALKAAIAGSGMLFVAASGNGVPDGHGGYKGVNNDATSTPALPASFDLPNILSVAAIDNRGALASFSNYGKTTVDISAPGVGILSTLPADAGHSAGWGWLDGTSMAAPHVTGVAALAISQSPDLATNIAALKARILGSGKSASKTSGKTVTGRLVDAYRALDVGAPTPPPMSSVGFLRSSILGKTVMAHLAWPAATDDGSGISAYGLQKQLDGADWATEVSATTVRTRDRAISFGTDYSFRVRARDGAQNWGDFSAGSPAVHATLYQQGSSRATYAGTWGTSKSGSWSAGSTKYSRKSGASVTFSFTGSAVAVVAPMGSTRGKFKFYVDGVYVATYDTHRSSTLARVLVAVKTWTGVGDHTVKVVNAGTSGHSRIDIDAFVVLQ